MTPEAISDLLVRMGPYVGQFVAKLFNVSEQHQAQSVIIKDEIDTIFKFKNTIGRILFSLLLTTICF